MHYPVLQSSIIYCILQWTAGFESARHLAPQTQITDNPDRRPDMAGFTWCILCVFFPDFQLVLQPALTNDHSKNALINVKNTSPQMLNYMFNERNSLQMFPITQESWQYIKFLSSGI